jgi:hypothetical protein
MEASAHTVDACENLCQLDSTGFSLSPSHGQYTINRCTAFMFADDANSYNVTFGPKGRPSGEFLTYFDSNRTSKANCFLFSTCRVVSDSSSNYVVFAGQALGDQSRGASLHQDRTCVSGQPCHIEGIFGNNLASGDSIALLDTCGVGTSLPWAGSSLLRGAAVTAVKTSGYVYGIRASWGSNALTSPGGLYRMCWCADTFACDVPEHFRVDVGRLTQIGPSAWAGLESGFRGYCGTGGILSVNLSGAGLTGLRMMNAPSSPLNNSNMTTTPYIDSSFACATLCHQTKGCVAAMFWDPHPHYNSSAGAVGETCRLHSECTAKSDESSHFLVLLVDFGRDSAQDRTCVSGRQCTLAGLRGQDLSSMDKLLLLDTCGSPQSLLSRGLDLMSTVSPLNGGVASFSTGLLHITAAGGKYRMCWCAGGFACERAYAFSVDVGELTLIGPAPLQQDRTCVSGQTCVLDFLTGEHLSLNDVWLLVDTCSTVTYHAQFNHMQVANEQPGSSFDATIVASTLLPTLAGGRYQLCWCTGPLPCLFDSSYRVDAGIISLVGPNDIQQDRTCVSGQTCSMESFGGYALAGGDLIMALDTCGRQEPVQKAPFAARFVINQGDLSASFESTFLTAPGGEYRLCWCAGEPANIANAISTTQNNGSSFLASGGQQQQQQNSSANDSNSSYPAFECTEATSFNVDLGKFTVIGPRQVDSERIDLALMKNGIGVRCLDSATGFGYMMFSKVSLHDRGFHLSPNC